MSVNQVQSSFISNQSITTDKIADGNVTTAKISTDAVNADKIAAGAVGTSEIATDAVNADKIAAGAVGTSEIADNAVTTAKISDSNITTAKIANSNVTAAKLADDVSAYLSFPLGGIVMWSGTIAQIPAGWYLCDGGTYGGIKTPDLRNRFIVGSTGNGTGTAASPSAGPTFDTTSGARSRNYTTHDIGGEDAHKLTIAELAAHTHTTHFNNTSAPSNGVSYLTGTNGRNEIYISTSDPTGGDKYHENRPLYYALAYIMKCEFRAGQTQTITTTVPTLQELRLNGPLYDQEMDGGAQKGNAGDVLTSLGDGNGVRWESRINLSTEQTYSPSGNTFTGIPSWAKRVTIIFDRISNNGTTANTSVINVLLGSSGTFTTTGYVSGSTIATNVNVVSGGTDTTAFALQYTNGAQQVTGHMVLTKMSGNKWVQSHTLGRTESGGATIIGGGVVTLPGTLDSIRILPNTATTSFDNGSFNIMYE